MPTRRLKDPSYPRCRHPEHNPPGLMFYANGTYEHECPHCGRTVMFRITNPEL